jgi:RNA polymerase sigma factor for flagellar operon FliA
MNASALEALGAWLKEPDIKHREACLEAWAPLVKRVWARFRVSLPPAADGIAEDLVQVGCIGLIQALDGFNPQAGASFETYARLRIRGAMLDELRRMDWLSKQSRQRWKTLQRAATELAQRLGRPASEEELALHSGLDIEGLRERLLECAPATLVFLDALKPDGSSGAWHDRVADPQALAPDHAPQAQDLKAALASAIGELPPQEHQLLVLLLQEELGHKEAAQALGVSPARVSQIYAKAVLHLQARLAPLF